MGFHKTFGGSGTDTSDATAQQWHIKNGKTAYLASGKVTGNAYTPAMMQYNGTNGYFSSPSSTRSGNKLTALIRFRASTQAGTSVRRIFYPRTLTSSRPIGMIDIGDISHADAGLANKVRVVVQNSAGTVICRLHSFTGWLDGAPHTLFFAFDGDAGTAIFKIGDQDATDAAALNHVAPTTGTLESGNFLLDVGGTSGELLHNDNIGFVGYSDTYRTNWSDLMQADGSPKAIDESSWTEWGAQPKFWNEHGQMDNNLGSAGNMTRNGTIVVGKGGNT